jgi:hypothetical protein
MANENRTFRSALDFRFQIKLAYQRDEKKSILKKLFFILLASFAPLHSHPAEFDNVNGENASRARSTKDILASNANFEFERKG